MNTLYYGTVAVRTSCYLGATFLVGRKLYQGVAAITLKAAADIFESSNLKNIGENYKQLAKKDLARDLKIAALLVGAGLVCERGENILLRKFVEIEVNKPIEQQFLQSLNHLKDSTNALYRNLFGPKKYFSEKVVETYSRTANYFVHDFRITRPYQETWTDTIDKIVNPQVKQVAKDFFNETVSLYGQVGSEIWKDIKHGIEYLNDCARIHT